MPLGLSAQNYFRCQWTGNGALPEGWVTSGSDLTPDGEAAKWFNRAEGWKQLTINGQPCVASFSTSTEGDKADSRLISPEIKVPQAGGFLILPMWTVNPERATACKISVYVSTSGISDADFDADAIFTKRIAANAPADNVTIPLTDYAGKSIRVAIVNEGKQAGILCLGDVEADIYKATIRNTTPLVSAPDKEMNITFLIDIQAICKGFDINLTTSDGFTAKLNNTVLDLSNGVKNLPVMSPAIKPEADLFGYTIELRPKIDGAEATVVEGQMAVGEGFESVCVMEEATGEKCGYCPAGSAVMERFAEMWPSRFIPVAVHCVEGFSTGVMENPDYSVPFTSMPGLTIESLPSAIINRTVISNPTDFNAITEQTQSILDGRSAMKVRIDRVDCDFESGHVDVNFTAWTCAPFDNLNVNAAVILTADGLTGTSRQWYQKNYFSGTSKEKFLASETDGEGWWPYMKFWCEYPAEEVSPTDYSFNHIAMGIYPDFNGQEMKSNWISDFNSNISFDMPKQQEPNGFGVQDTHATAVTVVLLRKSDGSILTASQVKAELFNQDLAGVEQNVCPESQVKISYKGKDLIIETAEPTAIDIYTLSGIKVAHIDAPDGTSTHKRPCGGVLIMKTPYQVIKTL